MGNEYIAIDLGAESGRVMCGKLDGGRLTLRECARFANSPVSLRGALHWDIAGIYREILDGLAAAAAQSGRDKRSIESIGIDTWGVDFCLLAGDGALLGLPAAYRDSRTDGMVEEFLEIMSAEEIYSRTGIQFMQINTLYQLFAMARRRSPLLEAASSFLMIPDYLNYLLTGRMTNEFTNATTTQLYNVAAKNWDARILEAAGVRPEIMQEITAPGSIIGELNTDDTGGCAALRGVRVAAPATHDTGSAVAAVPASGRDRAFISSGTWSLMGIETDSPDTSAAARARNFTNEGGAFGAWRFLKNIMGLWVLQRCRDEFDRRYSYEELGALAAAAQPFGAIVDVDRPRFLNPGSMTGEMRAFCRETGQAPPETPGEFARCALESLALKYRLTLDEIKEVRGTEINYIHVIGGGSKNELLCAMTANAAGTPVLAGPAEATAAGNVIVQAVAAGALASHDEARQVVARSFEIRKYEPAGGGEWEEALQKLKAMRDKNNE